MRIHFFTSFVHSQGTYFRFHNLARGLRDLGHDVEIFACDHDRKVRARTERRDEVPYHIVPVSRAASLFTATCDPWTTLTRGLAPLPPCDIAHLFQPFPVAALAWRRAPARARFWDWDDLWTHDPGPHRLRPLRRHWPQAITNSLEHVLPQAADHVTAIDHFLADLAQRRGAKETSILYNPSPPYRTADRQATRAEVGLDPEGLYAGFMGYTTAEMDWCLEGIARNLARFPRLRFVLCGPSLETLKDIPPAVAARVDCLGRLTQPQARAVAGAMDLALLPLEDNLFNRSRFPVKFSEYLMAGTPTLCSEVGECARMAEQISGVIPAGKTRSEWLAAFAGALDQAAARTLPPVERAAVHTLFSSESVCQSLAETYRAAISEATRASVKVFLVCSGLGRINRGFESFTQECFEALADHPALDLTVFKGAGRAERRQIVLPNLPRTHSLVEQLGRAIGKTGYWLEQVSFGFSLIPHVAYRQPDVICFMDCNVGNILWHWRRLTGQRFKIILSNGGPLRPPYPRWDFVQQLTPMHEQLAREAGQNPDTQAVIPYGIKMEPRLHAETDVEHDARRIALGLPVNRPLLLSVGVVNTTHKRMDYVVREVAALPAPRPYLVLLGQTDEETPAVRALAEQRLGSDGFQIRTVSHQDVYHYYRAADAFVLASREEGFGRVFLEAMSFGLPCLAHDYPVTRFVLDEPRWLADLAQPGSLTSLLCRLLAEGETQAAREARHRHVFEKFSWQRLTPRYVAMFQNCERGSAEPGAGRHAHR